MGEGVNYGIGLGILFFHCNQFVALFQYFRSGQTSSKKDNGK